MASVSRKRDAKKEMKMKAMQEYMKKENQIFETAVADMVVADKKATIGTYKIEV